MPTQTYTPISLQTLASPTTTITFSSIPSTYTDLVLVVTAQVASGTFGLKIQYNSDTATNYSNVFLYGLSSGSGSTRNATVSQINLGYGGILNSTSWWNSVSNIMNYSNTNTFKTTISRNGSGTGGTDSIVSAWRSTSAINSITITNTGSGINFTAGSTFGLYGIRAGD